MNQEPIATKLIGKHIIFPSIRYQELVLRAGESVLGRPARVLHSFLLGQVTEGNLLLHINGQAVELHKGDSLLLPPGTLLEYHSLSQSALQAQLILFHCVELHKVGRLWEGCVPQGLAAGKLAEPASHELLSLLISRFAQLSQPEKDHELTIILHKYANQVSTEPYVQSLQTDNAPSQPKRSPWSIEQILHYLQQHFTGDIRLSTLADAAGLSPNHFARMFKRQVGMTPLQYVSSLRLNRAKQLLFSSKKIKHIADQVGYSDEHYFSRAFKKAEGVSPLTYVRNRNHRIAALYYGLDDHLATLGYAPLTALSYHDRVDHVLTQSASSSLLVTPTPIRDSSCVLLDSFQSNYEQLLRLKPDVILTSDCMNTKEKLQLLAPTITLTHSYQPIHTLRQIADILGKEKQASDWIQHYEQQRHTIRTSLHEHWGAPSACFVRVRPDRIRIYGSRHQMSSLLYEELGMVLPLSLPAPRWIDVRTLSELWQKLRGAEHLFLMIDRSPAAGARLQAMLQALEWTTLPAVAANQVYDASDMLFTTLGPTGRLKAMKRIAAYMGAPH